MTFKIHIIFTFFCFLCFHKTTAQTYKFRTSGMSVLDKKDNNKWGKWSDLELLNVPIELDTDKHRIVVYTQMVQWFEISDYIATEENETDIVYSFICIDNVGTPCKLSIITRKLQGNRKQLYVNYDKRIIVYNIFNM
ncbi:hypothetical protein [Flavobacterium agrisoli]|uniref:Uncharacterized protein n=1 Tax=Flavobacterium agrisoli TaxID=2793066 RepID=A0A934UJ21_9FLAO|nr:hypothetical protein [Flavobacterium agrisoli]MBK0369149.1 hypothetical protein [Flavobacterium agrisoli]